MRVPPFEDPRALTVSGFSFLTCALNSITQTHMRHTTGQRAIPPQFLASTRAKLSPKAGLGGWHPPRISSEHRAGDSYMAPGHSRRTGGASPCQVVPSGFPLYHPSCQGSCRRVQPLTLVGKALTGLGRWMRPMHLLWDASTLLLHAPQSMLHAATAESLAATCADRADVCPAPDGGRTVQKWA